jgi:hypothetical protein
MRKAARHMSRAFVRWVICPSELARGEAKFGVLHRLSNSFRNEEIPRLATSVACET